MTPSGSREPRTLPPGRALLWFGEAIRLWKRRPVTFSLMGVAVVAATALPAPLGLAGAFISTVLAPVLACGLYFASLAADRNESPRLRHLFLPFTAPISRQLTVILSALVVTLVESVLAWWIADINLLMPASDTMIPPPVVIVIYASDVLLSLPLTFVPMAALFDGERMGPAFASSMRAFARNPQAMLALGAYTFVLVLTGITTMGIGLVLGLPWIYAAQYAAWKDIYGVASDGGAPREVS